MRSFIARVLVGFAVMVGIPVAAHAQGNFIAGAAVGYLLGVGSNGGRQAVSESVLYTASDSVLAHTDPLSVKMAVYTGDFEMNLTRKSEFSEGQRRDFAKDRSVAELFALALTPKEARPRNRVILRVEKMFTPNGRGAIWFTYVEK